MAMFNLAFRAFVQLEGGFSNFSMRPWGLPDTGASVRHIRITTRLKGLLPGDLEDEPAYLVPFTSCMGEDELRAFIQLHFWHNEPYVQWSQAISNKMLDLAIIFGPGFANVLLHRSLMHFGRLTVRKAGGKFAPVAQQALTHAIATFSEQAVLATLRAEQAGFCRQLAAANPALRENLPGWLLRAQA